MLACYGKLKFCRPDFGNLLPVKQSDNINRVDYSRDEFLEKIKAEGTPYIEYMGFLRELPEHEKSWLRVRSTNLLDYERCFIQDDTKANNKQVSTPSINNNDFEFSGLLNIPKNAGNWGFAIDDMARDFFKKNNRLPTNKAEAWTQLCTSPPAGYGITVVGKNEKLNIVSADPLTQRAFNGRWKRYTK